MTSPKTVNSKEILKQTEIKSIKTLTRWHQRGLIPPPEVRTHPSGRGKMAYWQEWVLGRCLTIRSHIKNGRSLDEVQELLDSNWAEEEKKWNKKRRQDYDVAAAYELLLYHQCERTFLEAADDRISVLELDDQYNRVERQLDSDMVKKALSFVRSGFNPVIVFDGDDLDIVPDFMVLQLLSNTNGGLQSLVVVPLFDDLVASFSPCDFDLPSEPSVTSVSRVSEGGTSKERAVIPIGKWGFELVDQPKRRGRSGE